MWSGETVTAELAAMMNKAFNGQLAFVDELSIELNES